MRRALVILTAVGILGLAACGGGSGGGSGADPAQPTGVTTSTYGSDGITDPINRAKTVVGQQNNQLQQEEQRTGADPTYP